jgi:ribosomal peptide maturation radical SAM protein 1
MSAEREPSVLLVSTPWTVLGAPSLGLGLLRAVLDQAGISCKVRHLSLFMLEHLRAKTYEDLADAYGLNDFMFSGAIEPGATNAQLRALRDRLGGLLCQGKFDPHRYGGLEGVMEMLLHLRSVVVPAWVEQWAEQIAGGPWTLVGFTCMFDQTIASVALANAIREIAPDKMIALGGYAVKPPTAATIVRSFPWIDAVCDGEGERIIAALARASVGEIALADVPGIMLRSGSGRPVATPAPPLVDLNQLPVPNYDDFFDDLRELSERHKISIAPPNLPIENSRGCWWGAKNHCTFCGIRDEDLAYRFRDPTLVLTAMEQLSERYGLRGMQFADYILPSSYFDTLLPKLAEKGRQFHIFAELKANLSDERFALLAAAGFVELQPGIESFSSDALRKMRKGVTAAQNVHTLVMGRKHGVRIFHNLLMAFRTTSSRNTRRSPSSSRSSSISILR